MKYTLVALLISLGIYTQADAQIPSITLRWTATGDDSLTGTATSYQLRWNNYAPTPQTIDAWWATSNRATGLPVPAPSGTLQTTTIAPAAGFPEGKTYFFVLRVLDEVPNISGYSNIYAKAVRDLTRPASPDDVGQ